MQQIANFIDAGHLNKIARQLAVPAVDVAGLAQRMAGSFEIRQTFYYDCLPFLSSNATPGERAFHSRKHGVLTALSYMPRTTVSLGRLACRGFEADGRPVLQQKRVDVALAADLVVAACKGNIAYAAIFAGDEDFIPAIEHARAEGVHVHLFHGASATAALIGACDGHTSVDRSFLESVQWHGHRRSA